MPRDRAALLPWPTRRQSRRSGRSHEHPPRKASQWRAFAPWCGRSLVVYAAEVVAGAGVDLDLGALVEEQRHLNLVAGLDGGVLGSTRRSVALQTGLSVGDLEDHGCRELDVERVTIVQRDGHVLVLEHEVGGVTDLNLAEGDLVVVARVHEHVAVAVLVQVLEVAAVDRLGLDLRARVERAVDGLSGADVLHLGADEGSALARLDVLELDDGPQSAIHVENYTVLDVSG